MYIKITKISIIILLTIILSVCGCARVPRIQKANMAYQAGKFNETEAILKYYVETKSAMKNPLYPLMLLTLADAQFRLGDYQSAIKSYGAAIKCMTANINLINSATNLLKNDNNRPYRGEPHDLALAHYYKGMCYFQLGEFNEARIEFAQARLEDKGVKAGQEDDLLIAHFMEGLCYERLNNLNEAMVSFKKVTEINPNFPYGWMELSFIAEMQNDKHDSDMYWDKYTSIVPKKEQMNRGENSECIFIIMDFGKGPYKIADAHKGEFAYYKKGDFKEDGLQITISDIKKADAYKAEDIFFQAKTEGGFAGDAARKVVSTVAKTAVEKLIPFGGLLTGSSSADIRVWYTLSSEIHMTIFPCNTHNNYLLNINFYDIQKNNSKDYLETFEQNWYYIPSQPIKSMKPIYLIGVDHLHNTLIDHHSISEEYIKENNKIKKQLERSK